MLPIDRPYKKASLRLTIAPSFHYTDILNNLY